MSAPLVAVAVFGVVLLVRGLGVRRGVVYAPLALVGWVALLESGVDPVVIGLAMAALLGDAETITDLVVPVDPDRDHVRGPRHAPVTIVEYGGLRMPERAR
ncbi:Na+/H+ antiporter NhaA [Streptomyces sp. NPDC059679]|uniref:Na+/H+ antiporter NhaA n=1 Tax=Streptomyces sp. NPDC059679 TaxID=3346903 RepID=UPI0036831274